MSICTSRNSEAGMDMGTAVDNAQMQADVQHESDTGSQKGSLNGTMGTEVCT